MSYTFTGLKNFLFFLFWWLLVTLQVHVGSYDFCEMENVNRIAESSNKNENSCVMLNMTQFINQMFQYFN